MIKAILLDLDETLLHERKSAEAVVLETVQPICREHDIDPEEMMRTVFEMARPRWHQMPTWEYCNQVAISSWEGLWGEFTGQHPKLVQLRDIIHEYRVKTWYDSMKAFNLDLADTAEEMATTYPMARRKRHIHFPETQEVMDKLYGKYPLALLTNGTPSVQWIKIRGSGLEKYFEHIIISGDLNTRKPDPVIFHAILERMDISADETIMIGDNLKSDIEGAARVGIKSVWVNRRSDDPGEGLLPDFIIKDLRELFEILN